MSEAFSAKWIVSSRNWPVIEGQFRSADKTAVSLELNKDSISEAVETFVRYKTEELARTKPYDEELKEAVLGRLLAGANDTFLWVALVCKELARPGIRSWDTLEKLDHLRTGLDDLYKRMLEQIITSDYSEVCRQILAIACVAYRPLSPSELQTLVPELQSHDSEALKDLIGECGSFLTLQEDAIYFVHQSAQDFLVGKGKETIFPSGISQQHRLLFKHSIRALTALRRDIYALQSPGIPIKDIIPPDSDPLSPLRYAIVYWIDHFGQLQGDRTTSDDEEVDKFLRKKYLYWLEATSLLHLMGPATDKIQRLKEIISHTPVEGLESLVEDARRFVLSYSRVIEEAPLQLYASALLFSPTSSVIRQLFKSEELSGLTMKPRAEPSWSACVLTLRSPFSPPLVCISPDGKLFAHSDGVVIKVFNTGWSHETHSINANGEPTRIEFSPNGEQLAVCLQGGSIELLDPKSGQRIRRSIGNGEEIYTITFSPNGDLLAVASEEYLVVWDLNTASQLQTMHCQRQGPISFSSDSQQLASGSHHSREIRVWDVATGDCILTIQAHRRGIKSLTFLSRGLLISSSYHIHEVKIWDLTEIICIQTLSTKSPEPSVMSLGDGSRYALFSDYNDDTVEIHNEQGTCLQTITVGPFSEFLTSLPGPNLLATISPEGISLWDLASKPPEEASQESRSSFSNLVLSRDGRHMASTSTTGTIKLWDTSAGTYEQVLEYVPTDMGPLLDLAFSENGQLLISQWDHDGPTFLMLVWDTASGNCLGTYEDGQRVGLSPDGQHLTYILTGNIIKVYDLRTGNCIWNTPADTDVRPFLVHGNRLVLASGNSLEVWDIPQSRCIASLAAVGLEAKDIASITSSHDSNMLVVSGSVLMARVWVWDLVSQELFHELEDWIQSPTISSDNELMAFRCSSYSWDHDAVEILKLNTGLFLHGVRLPARVIPEMLRFDPINPSRLHTNSGCIDLANSLFDPGVNIEDARHRPPHPAQYFGYYLSDDTAWILNGSARIFWLPPEYRRHVRVMGSTVSIAHEHSGRASVIRFSEDGQTAD